MPSGSYHSSTSSDTVVCSLQVISLISCKTRVLTRSIVNSSQTFWPLGKRLVGERRSHRFAGSSPARRSFGRRLSSHVTGYGTYTGGGLDYALSLAIDASGNI